MKCRNTSHSCFDQKFGLWQPWVHLARVKWVWLSNSLRKDWWIVWENQGVLLQRDWQEFADLRSTGKSWKLLDYQEGYRKRRWQPNPWLIIPPDSWRYICNRRKKRNCWPKTLFPLRVMRFYWRNQPDEFNSSFREKRWYRRDARRFRDQGNNRSGCLRKSIVGAE